MGILWVRRGPKGRWATSLFCLCSCDGSTPSGACWCCGRYRCRCRRHRCRWWPPRARCPSSERRLSSWRACRPPPARDRLARRAVMTAAAGCWSCGMLGRLRPSAACSADGYPSDGPTSPRLCTARELEGRKGSINFFKWAIPGLFFYIFVFSIQLTVSK